MINGLAFVRVIPLRLVVGVIELPGKAGSKMGQINHGCEDTLRLLIEWCNGLPESLGTLFAQHYSTCEGIHHLGFAAATSLGYLLLEYMIGQNDASYALVWFGSMAKARPPRGQMSKFKATK